MRLIELHEKGLISAEEAYERAEQKQQMRQRSESLISHALPRPIFRACSSSKAPPICTSAKASRRKCAGMATSCRSATEPVTREEAAVMLSEICGPKNWELFEERGDLDFAYEMDEASRFRCNFLKQANGYGAVFRLIPTKIATLEQLGFRRS